MDNPAAAATPRRILCIEDEHFISELYTRALTKAGFDVTVEVDGERGLKLAQSDQFDVILLDLMVPNMTGMDILKHLRGENAGAPIHSRIIITTNLDQTDTDRAAVETQADGYIVKAEVTPRELVAFLNSLN